MVCHDLSLDMQTHFYFLSTEVNKYLCETDIITIKTIVRPSLLQTKWYFPFTSPIPSTADTSRAQQKRLSCLIRACRAEDRGLVPVENFYQHWHVSLTLVKICQSSSYRLNIPQHNTGLNTWSATYLTFI